MFEICVLDPKQLSVTINNIVYSGFEQHQEFILVVALVTSFSIAECPISRKEIMSIRAYKLIFEQCVPYPGLALSKDLQQTKSE